MTTDSPPEDSEQQNEAINDTLFRLTQGLPRRELQLVVSEADECEAMLLKDIELLGKGLAATGEDEESLNALLDSVLTPLDRFWTASALLGRLRGDQALPRIPTAANVLPSPPRGASDDTEGLASISAHPLYTKEHETSNTLLNLYKKISSHRSSSVFKRPVKPDEAPGYTDRILFPMDLSLIRKMIVSRQIKSYKGLHENLGLIAHNCVKFNGRESDYGVVAREFEMAVDEAIRQAVLAAARKTPTPSAGASGATSPEANAAGS